MSRRHFSRRQFISEGLHATYLSIRALTVWKALPSGCEATANWLLLAQDGMAKLLLADQGNPVEW